MNGDVTIGRHFSDGAVSWAWVSERMRKYWAARQKAAKK